VEGGPPLIDPGTGGQRESPCLTRWRRPEKGIRNVGHPVIGKPRDVNHGKGFLAYTAFNRALLDEAKAALARAGAEQALAELQKNPKFAVFLKANC